MKNEIGNKGFTLIEMLACLAIFVVVFMIIINFIIWAYRSNAKFQALAEVSTQASRAMEIMVSEIKRADAIYLPTTTSTQLSLVTTHFLPDNEIFSYLDFFPCNEQICLKKETGQPLAITSEDLRVNFLQFIVIEGAVYPSIEIVLEMAYKNPGNKIENQASIFISSVAGLRNY